MEIKMNTQTKKLLEELKGEIEEEFAQLRTDLYKNRLNNIKTGLACLNRSEKEITSIFDDAMKKENNKPKSKKGWGRSYGY